MIKHTLTVLLQLNSFLSSFNQLFEDPAYGASGDVYLFPELKIKLEGQSFRTNDKFQNNSMGNNSTDKGMDHRRLYNLLACLSQVYGN